MFKPNIYLYLGHDKKAMKENNVTMSRSVIEVMSLKHSSHNFLIDACFVSNFCRNEAHTSFNRNRLMANLSLRVIFACKTAWIWLRLVATLKSHLPKIQPANRKLHKDGPEE